MSRKKIATLCIAFAAFCLYAILTGGMVVIKERDFGGQTPLRLAADCHSDIWIQPTASTFDMPFIFRYYSFSEPFDLRIQASNDVNKYKFLEINEVVIKHEDGVEVRNKVNWRRAIEPHVAYRSSGSVFQETIFSMSDCIKDIIKKHRKVKVTLLGSLSTENGEVIPLGFTASAGVKFTECDLTAARSEAASRFAESGCGNGEEFVIFTIPPRVGRRRRRMRRKIAASPTAALFRST